jgi:hypothetical protein
MNSVGGINVFGGTFPALVWHNFMVAAMESVPVEQFTPPDPTRPPTFLDTAKEKEERDLREQQSPTTSGGTGTTTYEPPPNTPPGFTFPPPTTAPRTPTTRKPKGG